MKKLFILIVILGAIATVFGGYYYQQYQNFVSSKVFEQDTIVTIPKGQSYKKLVESLVKRKANGENWQWRMFARLEKVGQWLTVGEFNITADLTPLKMMRKIKSNDVITYKFTIVEGMNWRELKLKTQDNKVLVHKLSDLSDEQLQAQFGDNRQSLEGLFLPETYQFIRGDSDVDVLKRAHSALKEGLQQHWKNRKPNLPLKNPYELLTLASIVEKETALPSERETIAGVFVRRLQKNMRLQTDPTVIYGLGENYDGDIKSKDLKTDTPYNTYTRKGLTPTPIAMASIESIEASANPEDGNSLYFVANNRGGHYFSETYEQHQKAVRGYLKGEQL